MLLTGIEQELTPRPRYFSPPTRDLLGKRQRRAVAADVRDLTYRPLPRLRLGPGVGAAAGADLAYINRLPDGFGDIASDLKAAGGGLLAPFVAKGEQELGIIKGKIDDVALLLKISAGASVLSALIALWRR